MSGQVQERDAVFAWDPALGGAVISVVVDRLSQDGEGSAFARVGVEDERPYLEQVDGARVILAEIALDDVLEALDMGVTVVREFEAEGEGPTREYRIESLAPATALRM